MWDRLENVLIHGLSQILWKASGITALITVVSELPAATNPKVATPDTTHCMPCTSNL